MDKVYILGHQKPDTDSITAAISLSYLKNQLGMNTIPVRIGNVNSETRYVLDYFDIKTPPLIEDVKLQIKDLFYHKDYYVNYRDSIISAYKFMVEKGITGIPVVDDDKKLLGIVTQKIIVGNIIDGNIYALNTSYQNIMNTLEGEEVLKFDDEIKGNVLAATYKSTTFMDTINLTNENILIVGDRHSVIEYAINSKVKMIIVVGNNYIKPEHIELAKQNHVNIIRTKFDSFRTTKAIDLSNYVYTIIPGEDAYTFNENDYYDEFVIKTGKLKHNNYPVIGKNGICKGLIRITDMNEMNRKKVILVDHNETSQSVEGLDEAEIVEIVDHHKIGDISTKNPINFRNMSVGSTNTIIYEMYKENNIDIPKQIAGLMLSGIVSDTLILTSPTTTNLDKEAVEELSKIANVDYQKYALDMFKEGTSLQGKTVPEIVNTDIKAFVSENGVFAVSQVFTLDIDSIMSKKQDYIDYINNLASDRGYKTVLLVITDIIKNGSYLLYTSNTGDIIGDAFNIDNIEQGFYIDGVVSRKKQIVPKLMDVIR